MNLSKALFPKRKRTSNNSSDGEGTHPSSKRNAPPTDISSSDNMKSPANLASEPSPNQKIKQQRWSTLPGTVILRILFCTRKDSGTSESGVDTETTEGYYITEFMKKTVMLCAVRRMEEAKRAGKTYFDLEEIVSRALDWMRNLTHQDHYLDTKCCNGEVSDFRERLEWADFNVRLAEEQLEQEAKVDARKRNSLDKIKQLSQEYDLANQHQAEEEASQSPQQQSSREATLPLDEKEHTKQNATEEAVQIRAVPEQITAHTNRPASEQGLNAASMSYRAVRPTSDEYIGQLQRTMMLGAFENQETAPTPSLPSASASPLPSYHALKASVDARRTFPRAAAREQLAFRTPQPPSHPLTVHTTPLPPAANELSTTPPLAPRTLPPPIPLDPDNPRPISPSPQSFTTTRHRGPTDYRPSGPTNPFARNPQGHTHAPRPFRRHARRNAITHLPSTAFLLQNIPVPGATPSPMQRTSSRAPAPAPAPAPSQRVARYRETIAPAIEAHVRGASALASPRRWFRARTDENRRQ